MYTYVQLRLGSLGQTEVIEGCRLEETEAVPLNTAITEQYAVLTALAAVVRILIQIEHDETACLCFDY